MFFLKDKAEFITKYKFDVKRSTVWQEWREWDWYIYNRLNFKNLWSLEIQV